MWAIKSDAVELQRFLQDSRTFENDVVDPVDSRQAGICIVAGKQNTKQGGEISRVPRPSDGW